MGITGLLPFLDKSSTKCNISKFAGGTVAIDSYCWLHKGAFSCADKLVMGQQTDAYVKYCMKYVQMLLDAKIKPILVFDGRHLQAKAETEVKRREQRKLNRKKGAELMRMGNTAEGRNLLRRSLDISHKMALELIKECQSFNIDCIVAPYEADAQLAYLNISGIADVVITEDSDLTLFGCRKIFFKMDLNGNGVLVEQDRLHISMGVKPENFVMEKFRYMCILSGCDYLASLPGIGLAKACKFISKISDCDIQKALPRMGAYLNMKTLNVTKEYIDAFIKADVTFKHQLVYCPMKRKQVRLYPPGSEVSEEQLKFAGEEMSDEELAWQVALGNHDPFTLEKLHNFDPDNVQTKKTRTNSWAQQPTSSHTSIWSKSFDTSARQVPKQDKSLKMPSTVGQVALITPKIVRRSVKRSFDEYNDCDGNEDLSEEQLLKLYSGEPENEKPAEQNSNTIDISKPATKEETVPTPPGRVDPFKKQSPDESPSFLARGRKRCMLRFKPTVIDNAKVVQSKFFAQMREAEDEKKAVEVPDSRETENAKEDGGCDEGTIIGESPCLEDSVLDVSGGQNDSVVESVSCLRIQENGTRMEAKNISPANSDKDDYVSMGEISARSNLFQFNNPKLNSSSSLSQKKAQVQKSRQSLTRQSSVKKAGAKKLQPIAGQSLLNRFGFDKWTVKQ